MSRRGSPNPASDKRWFATTRWSLVVAAADSQDPGSREALEALCQHYWPPIYSYVRSRGHDADTALDLTQGFFTRLLEKHYLRQVKRERGRFRSFLLSSVKHYLANEWDRGQTLKRGAGATPLSLDRVSAERAYRPQPADHDSPDKAFEKRWAVTLLDRTLAHLEHEMARRGYDERFRRLRPFLTVEGGAGGYRRAAEELDMTETAVKVAVHRMRRRFAKLLRDEVAQTVADPEAIDGEIRFLFAAMES